LYQSLLKRKRMTQLDTTLDIARWTDTWHLNC